MHPGHGDRREPLVGRLGVLRAAGVPAAMGAAALAFSGRRRIR